MESKSLFASRTFWANILTPAFAWLGTNYGLQLDAEAQTAVISLAVLLVNIVMRKVTSRPVHIIPPKE